MRRVKQERSWRHVFILVLGCVLPISLCGQNDSGKQPQNSESHNRPGVTAPHVIYDPSPDYPGSGRNGLTGGTVVLNVLAGTDGRTRDPQVLRSLSPGFDKEAINAVKRWRFKPATKDGMPVAVRLNVEVSFRLY